MFLLNPHAVWEVREDYIHQSLEYYGRKNNEFELKYKIQLKNTAI